MLSLILSTILPLISFTILPLILFIVQLNQFLEVMFMTYSLQDILNSILTAVQDILGNVASAIADNANVIATMIVLGGLTVAVVRYGSAIFRRISGFIGGLM